MTNINTYFFKGMKAVNPTFQYDRLAPAAKNEIGVIGSSHTYNGVTDDVICPNDKRVVIVDQTVRISTVSNAIRNNAKNEWQRLKAGSHKTFLATVITATVALAAGVVLGFSAIAFPPLIIAAIPVLVIGVALLVVAIRSRLNEKRAVTEFNKWNDPVSIAVNHRKQAGQKGFNYVRDHQLSGKYFHAEETEKLWYNAVNNFNSNDPKTFFNNNPLEAKSREYAFEGKVPQHVRNVAIDYDLLEKDYLVLQNEIKRMKKSIVSQKEHAVRELEKQRDAKLLPAKLFLERRNGPLGARRSQFLNDPTKLAQIDKTILANKNFYKTLTAPITNWYNNGKKAWENWAAKELKKIQASEAQEISKFQAPCDALVQKYKTVQLPSSNSPNIRLQDIHPVAPSAPQLEELNPPAYNPDWSDAYGISEREYLGIYPNI